jgi:hypothetical protein
MERWEDHDFLPVSRYPNERVLGICVACLTIYPATFLQCPSCLVARDAGGKLFNGLHGFTDKTENWYWRCERCGGINSPKHTHCAYSPPAQQWSTDPQGRMIFEGYRTEPCTGSYQPVQPRGDPKCTPVHGIGGWLVDAEYDEEVGEIFSNGLVSSHGLWSCNCCGNQNSTYYDSCGRTALCSGTRAQSFYVRLNRKWVCTNCKNKYKAYARPPNACQNVRAGCRGQEGTTQETGWPIL